MGLLLLLAGGEEEMSAHVPSEELDCQHEYVALGEPFPVGDSIRTREPFGAQWFGQCVFSAPGVSVVLVKAVDDMFGDSKVKPGDKIAYRFAL